MKLFLKKQPGGSLVPDDDDALEWLQGIKTGTVISANVSRPRNYRFHRLMMALYRTCFDYFSEHVCFEIEYKGIKAEPSFDRFRKDLTIMAGHYNATYDIKGNVRLEAKSINFASCPEEEAKQIYSDVINAALKHVYKGAMTEAELQKVVDDILRFA